MNAAVLEAVTETAKTVTEANFDDSVFYVTNVAGRNDDDETMWAMEDLANEYYDGDITIAQVKTRMGSLQSVLIAA
jgi:hypothetical protein